MNRWMIGGIALAAAAIGGAVAVFFVGRPGDPPAAAPGGAAEVKAAADPTEVPPPEGSGYFIEEFMPMRDVVEKDGKAQLRAYAGRRLYADKAVYFVRFWRVEPVSISISETRALIEFLKNPRGNIPAGATKGERRVAHREWETRDLFGTRPISVEAALSSDSFEGNFGDNFAIKPVGKDFAAALERLLADIDFLKTLPAKR